MTHCVMNGIYDALRYASSRKMPPIEKKYMNRINLIAMQGKYNPAIWPHIEGVRNTATEK